MNTVWVVNNSGHDMSKASEFGEVVNLTEGRVAVFSSDRIYSELSEKLSGIKPGDYILLSGYALLNVFACIVSLERIRELNVLLYDFNNQAYIKRSYGWDFFFKVPNLG